MQFSISRAVPSHLSRADLHLAVPHILTLLLSTLTSAPFVPSFALSPLTTPVPSDQARRRSPSRFARPSGIITTSVSLS